MNGLALWKAVQDWARDPARRRLLALVGGPVVLGVVCGGVGYYAGRTLHPRTVTVTETKTVVQTVEHTVTVEKPVIKWLDRVSTRTIYRDGPVREVDRTETHSTKVDQGRETTNDVKTASQTESKSSVTTSPEGRWSVRALTGVSTSGGIQAGAAAGYRVIGPLEVGAFGLFPISGSAPVTVGLSVGLRL